MKLIKIFTMHFGKCLDITLCSLMPICGCIAVSTFLKKQMTVSFGCEDSRKYAQISKDRVAVGIPGKCINTFLG